MKTKKILNPGKSCADCKYHECDIACMKDPREMCRGICTLKDKLRKCDASGKMCKDFKQLDWRNYTDEE